MRAIKTNVGLLCVMGSMLLAIGLLTFSFVPSVAAETIKLRYSSFTPPRGVEAESSMWMLDEIEKRTNGKVKFERYYGGALLKPRETLSGIQKGTVDMGHVPTAYHPKEFPLWGVALPFVRGPLSPAKKSAFWWELYKQSPDMAAELEKWNLKLVAVVTWGKMSINAPKPIKSLADLKGKRVRCAGGYQAKLIMDLGAKTVFLRGSEAYSALQKGAVDANYTAFTSYYKYRLFEVGKDKHLLIIPQFTGNVGLIAMNIDSWNKLPDDVQKIISSVGREGYSKILSEKTFQLEREYLEELKKMDITIIELTKEDIDRWADLSEESSKAKWVKEVGELGYDSKTLMDRASKLIKKY